MLGSLIHRLSRLCGYAIVSNARYEDLRTKANYKPCEDVFNEHLRRVFKMLGVTTVLDVGASEGFYAESLRRDVGFEGWIHSFEPLPGRHEVLKNKIAKDPRWVLHTCALGAESGEAELNVAALDVFSSLREPDPNQPAKYLDSNKVIQKIKVPVRTLTEMMPEILASSGNGPVYLKLDTQGFDLQVFMGAKGVLDQIVALQTELAFRTIYAGASDWLAMTAELATKGYKPSYFLPISFDDGLTILEADGIFIRRPEA